MLDNLANTDLSGLTGHISYTYNSMSQILPAIFISIAILILFIALAIGMIRLFYGSRTNRYREQLVDMYVSATVRKFAKDDGLDLAEEYKNYIKESKKEKLEDKNLSKVVEEELSEKVILKQEKKINKESKK